MTIKQEINAKNSAEKEQKYYPYAFINGRVIDIDLTEEQKNLLDFLIYNDFISSQVLIKPLNTEDI